ncbi:hypothetical protein IFM89_026176 [Coptis chinensis]|uniref:Exonuclease domain-containing protein n=1 Tax=Coptis chinensis TaxID=261450 RepID=A0A835LFT7_9MAGN|nr:hypothetical protein IFM89_026176 [Coptis chinensis]
MVELRILVERGVPLSEALLMHDKWLEDKGIKHTNFAVVTWSNWDCRVMLESECRFKRIRKPPYFNRWINLRVPFNEVFGGVRCNLKEAVQLAGLAWEGRAHCGLDDARNTARLIAKLYCCGFRCRTCCKSRGYDCATHIKSTWVPAAHRRERHQLSASAAVDASSGSTSGVKKPRLINSQTTTSHTSTSNTTPPRSFDTSSSHQEALPGQVRVPAVLKCVRVTAIGDGEDEYAYQAVVKIGGMCLRDFYMIKEWRGERAFQISRNCIWEVLVEMVEGMGVPRRLLLSIQQFLLPHKVHCLEVQHLVTR